MQTRIASIAFALLFLAGSGEPVEAATRCVPMSHPGPCDHRYATIQEAVNAAAPAGDSILVGAGTYVEQVIVQGKSVALFGARVGEDARGRVAPETIVSHPMGALLGCGDGLVVDGFTFTGATDLQGNWAAAWIDGTPCVAGSNVTFRNNIVRDSISGMIVNSAVVSIERNWFVANNAVPQYSLGLQAAATSDDRIERNRFEAHVGPSIELAGTARMSILRNEFDGRVVLRATTDSTFEGNAGFSSTTGAVLFEVAGGVHRTAFLGNTLSVASGRAVWLTPEGTGNPNSAIVLRGNCLRGSEAVGLEVAAGAHSGPLDAASNWWGAASGPAGAGPGTGAAIVDPGGAVTFAPFDTSAAACPCAELPNGSACDDGDACTAADQCLSGSCRSGVPIACDDANDCTIDSCDPQSGSCVHSSAHCNDGDPCTIDSCEASGQCAHLTVNCDDGNSCTSDGCDPGGGCTHAPLPGPCDDGNPCTGNDLCSQGVCVSGAFACDDGNVCTTDSCDPSSGQCTNTNQDSNSCSDGSACTTGDRCVSGSCVPGPPLTCNDANPCTTDLCHPIAGCMYSVRSGPCDDGDPCTLDGTCSSQGTCLRGPNKNCDDDNLCTDDSCEPASGVCLHVNDDTNVCFTGGACGSCAGGACTPVPPNCDDGVACTVDGCDAVHGCYHNPDSSLCPPIAGDCAYNQCYPWGCQVQYRGPTWPCTDPETCGRGRCGDGGSACNVYVPCVALDCQRCDRATGQCIQDSCDDGNPCTLDYCTFGFCEHSSANCADNDPCTTDACNAAGQCEHTATVCNDWNPCTDDACVAGIGCVSQPNSAACDDGNPCTDDACSGGSCQSVADDTNACVGGGQLCVSSYACHAGACQGIPGDAAEVRGLRFPSGKNSVAWDLAPTGPSLQYQLLRGMVGALPVGSVPASEACVAQTTFQFASVTDSPAAGAAHWYLVRVTYATCDGIYGFQGVNGVPGAPRSSAACP